MTADVGIREVPMYFPHPLITFDDNPCTPKHIIYLSDGVVEMHTWSLDLEQLIDHYDQTIKLSHYQNPCEEQGLLTLIIIIIIMHTHFARNTQG
jgi:hypothetical protein